MPIKANTLRKLVFVCLLADWSSHAFAATVAAILHPIADVRVNGTAVSHSTVIFNGDMIRTGVSAARLEAYGYAILLDKETTALLQDDQTRVREIVAGNADVMSGSPPARASRDRREARLYSPASSRHAQLKLPTARPRSSVERTWES